MRSFLGQHPLLAGFTITYLLAAGIGTVATGNMEFVFYLVTVCLLAAAVLWLHSRVELSSAALWGLSLWGVLHMAGGLVPIPSAWVRDDSQAVLYSWWLVDGWLKFDHVVHAFGFAVATVCCWQGLRAQLAAASGKDRDRVEPRLGAVMLAGLAGCGLGAMNEVVEFTATVLVPETNVGGYLNTALDLVANFVGATLAAGWLWIRGRSGRR